MQFIFEVTRDGSFNYGHWLFSFTYIASAIEMPYIFKKETVSEKTESAKTPSFGWSQLSIFSAFSATPSSSMLITITP